MAAEICRAVLKRERLINGLQEEETYEETDEELKKPVEINSLKKPKTDDGQYDHHDVFDINYLLDMQRKARQ